jgi:hypothetical protein
MPATLSDLEQQNPNIRSQIQEWQGLRAGNGENPADWEAFRQHARGIGAPDPGQEAPPEFAQSAAGAGSRAASAASSGTFAGQQPQQPQQPPQQQWQQPSQPQAPQQPQHSSAELEAIQIRNDYEADKNTPTDKWLKARGMTKAQLDAALALAASAEPRGTA